jgi:hypothetical protein
MNLKSPLLAGALNHLCLMKAVDTRVLRALHPSTSGLIRKKYSDCNHKIEAKSSWGTKFHADSGWWKDKLSYGRGHGKTSGMC